MTLPSSVPVNSLLALLSRRVLTLACIVLMFSSPGMVPFQRHRAHANMVSRPFIYCYLHVSAFSVSCSCLHVTAQCFLSTRTRRGLAGVVLARPTKPRLFALVGNRVSRIG